MKSLFARTALAAMTLDLALKLVPLGPERVLLPGILRLAYAQNHGAAFSLLAGTPGLSLLLSVLVIVVLGCFLPAFHANRTEALAMGLLMGGALGNLADRLLHGAVSDYLELMMFRFPVFNFADACITLGAALLAVRLLKPYREGNHG